MALIQISNSLMVNTDKIDTVEFVPGIDGIRLIISIEGKELEVTKDPRETLTLIQKEIASKGEALETLKRNSQFFNG